MAPADPGREPTWTECVARVAFGTGATFVAVWVGRGLHRGASYMLSSFIIRDMAIGLGLALLCAAPVATLLRGFYRAPLRSSPQPAAILWSMARIFLMAPLFVTLLLFAICVRMLGLVAPGLARGMRLFAPHVPNRDWINADVLARSWVGLPMWVIFWMSSMNGRSMRLVWDHARMQTFTRAWFPFVLAGVALLSDMQPRRGPVTEPAGVAAFLSFAVCDFLVLAAHAGAWKVGQGLVTEDPGTQG